jgi:hypothetical protein
MNKLLVFITAALLLVGCFYNSKKGSGNIISQKRDVATFTAIDASTSVDVEVRTGPASVEVQADDNILKYVKTKVSSNTLYLGIEGNVSLRNTHIKILVTVPNLKRIEAGSSASVKVMDVLKSDNTITFDVGSSADIVAEVDAPEIEAEAGSSGTLTLSGRTKNYTAKANSSGNINSFELKSENTNVSASSSGSAEVHASVTLDANASSSGRVEYTGGATVKSSTSSSGSISKSN